MSRTLASRRQLLAGSSLGATLATIGLPVVTPSPDATLLATCARFAALTASVDRMNAASACDWAELEDTNVDWHDVLDEVAGLRPITPEGMRAKTTAVMAAFRLDVPHFAGSTVEDCAEPHDRAAWALLNDILLFGAA